MIFIDFNNMFSRHYSVAINLVQPELNKIGKKNPDFKLTLEQYSDIKKAFFNLFIKDLAQIKTKFQQYGDLLIANDYNKSKYWRRRYSSTYKVKDIKEDKIHDMAYKNSREDKEALLDLLRLTGINIIDRIEVNDDC